jgi:hypothetical protein
MIRHLTDGTVLDLVKGSLNLYAWGPTECALDLVRGPHAYQWPNQQHAAGRQAGRQRRRGSRLSSRVSVKAEAERPWSSGRREFNSVPVLILVQSYLFNYVPIIRIQL